MAVNYGSKRVVVGAHYGLRDWLAQRVTAVLMALFTVLLLAQVLFTKRPLGYELWASIFSAVKIAKSFGALKGTLRRARSTIVPSSTTRSTSSGERGIVAM